MGDTFGSRGQVCVMKSHRAMLARRFRTRRSFASGLHLGTGSARGCCEPGFDEHADVVQTSSVQRRENPECTGAAPLACCGAAQGVSSEPREPLVREALPPALKMRRQMRPCGDLIPSSHLSGYTRTDIPAHRQSLLRIFVTALPSLCRRSHPTVRLLHLVPAREAGDPEPQGAARHETRINVCNLSGLCIYRQNAQTCHLDRDLADCLVCVPDRQPWRSRSSTFWKLS
ncbi:uncharacterized protein B0H64DRAFT_14793 [Chaetomium fimeti]|uniref:Uncharacterized protein n=1 Tax=Chaetomium fimeti TaxID=1854472 RepID=A0AAE0HQ99_9PEZI|nr:hypothetical protein B0H64DRAFT_14793 [Chaetomium fimeti]